MISLIRIMIAPCSALVNPIGAHDLRHIITLTSFQRMIYQMHIPGMWITAYFLIIQCFSSHDKRQCFCNPNPWQSGKSEGKRLSI